MSPLLFTLYLDGLLKKLKESGIGCHIGRNYCGVFGYADDLAIVSPTTFGLKQMIAICEDYANEYSILFNPKKSKLLCYNMFADEMPVIKLCNHVVEVVDNEVYLGSRIYNDIYTSNIDEYVCDFERRSNHVIHNFAMCDSVTLSRIFSSHCESFYGCELFNHSKPYMSKLYVSWRKIIRHIFHLHPWTHNYIVANLGNCVIERLDRRICKFIYKLLHSENVFVQQVTRHKLFSPTSILAENYRYLCYKYKIAHEDWYSNMNFVIKKICMTYTNHQYAFCNTVLELCNIRDGVSFCEFVNITDICNMIESLCID